MTTGQRDLWSVVCGLVVLLLPLSALAVGPIRGNSGNATVPSDAPIQPAQAFVDSPYTLFLKAGFNDPFILDLSNKGITSILGGSAGQGGLYDFVHILDAINIPPATIDLRGNAITNTDEILIAIAREVDQIGTNGGELKLEGGTNAAPSPGNDVVISGAGSTEANGTYSLINVSWGTDPKNIFYQFGDADHYIQWDGTGWSIYGLSCHYKSSENVDYPWLATTWSKITGSTPVPTVSRQDGPNPYITFLESAPQPWTVTTN